MDGENWGCDELMVRSGAVIDEWMVRSGAVMS